MTLFRALHLLVGTSFRVAPGTSIGCLAETGGVLVSLLPSWMLALFIGAAARQDARGMALTASLFVAQIAVSRLLFVIGMNARMNQLERVGEEFSGRAAHITATIPTVDPLDDSQYLDQLHILREQQGALGLAVNTLLNQVNNLVGVVGVLTLAATADPRMLLVAAASIPTVITGPVIARWHGQAETKSAEPGRLAKTLLNLGIAPEHGGEIRAFQLAGPLRARQASASRAWRAPMLRLAVKESSLTAATQVLFFGVVAVVVGWLVRDVLDGAVDLAAMTLALLLVTRLQGVSSNMRSLISEVASISRTAGRYLWLLGVSERLLADHVAPTGSPAAEPPEGPATLRLQGIGYRYPGADRDALQNVHLTLGPGTVLAVVGENGAGKSTLAEVIAGIRAPTTGHLLAGGANLQSMDLNAWRQRVSAAFQDHVRFEFPVSDVIGVGDLPNRTCEKFVRQAAKAGAADGVVAAVPHGLRTQLGSGWPDGVELSGGQWQRLAIARSMMRKNPLVRVLDEPTAALDAITEHQLFSRYAAAARSGRESGTITILITHRFSTVAAADLIIVLEHGRIVEHGSHQELMDLNGQYADLYNLQARGYQGA